MSFSGCEQAHQVKVLVAKLDDQQWWEENTDTLHMHAKESLPNK